MIKTPQSGQILLVVVLTMIVALTVGLSIAARIVTELKLSKQNEESQRAFQAAEAGVQRTLENGAAGSPIAPIKLGNNSSFSTKLIPDNGPAIVMNNEIEVDQAVGGDVWLSTYSSNPATQFQNPMGCNGTTCNDLAVTLYWGSPNQTNCNPSGDNVAPAMEVVLLKGPIATPSISKGLFEATGCLGDNRLSNISSNVVQATTTGGPFYPKVGGPAFRYKADITFNGGTERINNGLVMKVIPIFNSTMVGFQANVIVGSQPPTPIAFPLQGSHVESTGTSGDTIRKVVYYQSYPQMPLEVFPYSLLSQ